MWKQGFIVWAVSAFLLTGTSAAMSQWGGRPKGDEVTRSIMLWKAAQICPDFPMTEKQALKRIEDYKSKNGRAEHIDKMKDELGKKFEGILRGFMGSTICGKARSKAKLLLLEGK